MTSPLGTVQVSTRNRCGLRLILESTGETHTLSALARMAGVSVQAMRHRWMPAGRSDLDRQWIDLMRACGLEDDGGCRDWGWAVAAAIQTIGELTNRRDDLLALLTKDRADNARLCEEKINRANAAFLHTVGELKSEIDELRAEIANLNERNRLLHNHVGLGESQLTKLRAELTIAQQSRDEWEQRAVQAEANVETMEADLRNREDAPAAPSIGYCCTDSGLLDIALAVLREEPVTSGDLATLIDAARRAA